MSNDRDRLIEIIINADTYDSYDCKLCAKGDDACDCCFAEKIADHLLANGVIVPPCKVGDNVYTIHKGNYEHNWKPYVDELCVVEINHKCDRSGKDIGWGLLLYSIDNHTTTRYRISNVGKTVFLTKEEAERKLKELNK